jgi:hypothetical protein
VKLLAFINLFAELRAPSWDGWRKVFARLDNPTVREFYGIIGRGAGKSRIVSVLACYFASREYRRVPGESIYIGVFAPDRKQAGLTFRYILGLLRSVPALNALITDESKDSVELSNGIIIEVITASIAAPRGRAYALVIVEEAAFLPTDVSANPDVELLRAVRPALARVPGSLLVVVSSPYARRGVLWSAWQRYHNQPDGDVVLVQADTLSLNPTFDARAIDRAYADDPTSASAEYGAQFRSDVETYVQREAIEAVVVSNRLELPRTSNLQYRQFLDFAGGGIGGDSATQAIAHLETLDGRAIAVLDLLREVRPPFSPETVCSEFAATSRSYGLTTAIADRWAGQFPVEQMRKLGITVTPSDKSKSDIYRDLLPMVNSGGCELLDHPRLISQLASLERRTARGGKDSIDHAPGGHDDVINAAAGALVLAGLTRGPQPLRSIPIVWGVGSYGPGSNLPSLDQWQAQQESVRQQQDAQRAAMFSAAATLLVQERDSGWIHQIKASDFDPARHRPYADVNYKSR